MTTENAVAIKDQTAISLPQLMTMAETLIKSGFLPMAIKTPAQAVAIIMTGRELGIPTMQALRQINVIQGKPTMAAELMLALAYQHVRGFKYELLETTATQCVCKFTRPGHKALTHTFTMDDAKALGLAGKDNWKKQPATMLRWRCISSGLRLVAPDAIAGVYTPEEIMPDAMVNEESGTIIDVESSPVEPGAYAAAIKGIEDDTTAWLQEQKWITPEEDCFDLDEVRKQKTVERIDNFKKVLKAWKKVKGDDAEIEQADTQRHIKEETKE